ncbi:galactose-1-phosphate uridylyltransferase [Candidatus Latescibacterota bacterium]
MNKRQASSKRWNPLLGEWVIIAPVTADRPWSGSVIDFEQRTEPEFDPDCYLCPGVRRAGGAVNPNYTGVYIFNNDFPSLSMDSPFTPEKRNQSHDTPVQGICRVVCFSPKHNITLSEMESKDISEIIHAFCNEFKTLSSMPEIRYVMIFENRGRVIGVSNPHPHGQIYATDFVPRIPMTMYANAEKHMKDSGKCLFCTILESELADGARIVTQNNQFVAYVPYFARHAYEIHIMPRRHVPFMTGLSDDERDSLAGIYKEIMVRYDNLFQLSAPNINIFNNAPCDDAINPEPYHFHIEFYPPLRSRDKLKYMAGFESGSGNIINPSLPEESAKLLGNVSTIHYLKKS